jgi:two-component system chemotaxis response regulator CheY
MKILIVEDDFTSSMMMQGLLEPYAKCDVAINGRKAVEAFTIGIVEGKPHDLILLDIMMPEMDGQEVVHEVRKIEEEEWGIIYPKGIKIIMTTALEDPRNVVTAFKSLCDAYLVKPIAADNLFTAIREFFPDFGK